MGYGDNRPAGSGLFCVTVFYRLGISFLLAPGRLAAGSAFTVLPAFFFSIAAGWTSWRHFWRRVSHEHGQHRSPWMAWHGRRRGLI
jgi:hypothetical protein